VKAAACVEDAKSVIRWLRTNADKLAIDPNRICAAGGSAGGHIACATALLPGLDAKSDDLSVSCVPDALALFNPAVVLAPIDGLPTPKEAETRLQGLKLRLGAEPEAMSPAHHVRSGLPPAIIFHGESDTTVPPATARKFTTLMQDAGNRCELKTYPGAPHGFFNLPGEGGGGAKKKSTKKVAAGQDQRSVWHRVTLRELDLFLVSLGWISGEPAIPETKTP
jgi:acetyl esterase/lipase